MQRDDVLAVFRECGAILDGHFILTSGLHSPTYIQKARVFMHAEKTEILCRALSKKITSADLGRIDLVVGPAVGGIIPAYEVSRHLGVPNVWVEREDGKFRLRRFEMEPGTRVVIIEDIVTTGLSIRETIESLRDIGVEVLAAACLVDRSAGKADIGIKLVSLADFNVPAYRPEEIPAELAAIPAVKPGSRNL